VATSVAAQNFTRRRQQDCAYKERSDSLYRWTFRRDKEQLGGYHLIDCMDLNEAMSIAARIPTLPAGGTVEVRCIEALEC
jgi:hypothetical protein